MSNLIMHHFHFAPNSFLLLDSVLSLSDIFNSLLCTLFYWLYSPCHFNFLVWIIFESSLLSMQWISSIWLILFSIHSHFKIFPPLKLFAFWFDFLTRNSFRSENEGRTFPRFVTIHFRVFYALVFLLSLSFFFFSLSFLLLSPCFFADFLTTEFVLLFSIHFWSPWKYFLLSSPKDMRCILFLPSFSFSSLLFLFPPLVEEGSKKEIREEIFIQPIFSSVSCFHIHRHCNLLSSSVVNRLNTCNISPNSTCDSNIWIFRLKSNVVLLKTQLILSTWTTEAEERKLERESWRKKAEENLPRENSLFESRLFIKSFCSRRCSSLEGGKNRKRWKNTLPLLPVLSFFRSSTLIFSHLRFSSSSFSASNFRCDRTALT